MPEIRIGKNDDKSSDRLFYLDPNPTDSPAIVLLHGLGSNSSSWQLQTDALIINHYRPIILDLPGFGNSPCLAKDWSIPGMANWVYRLMTHLGINQYSVAGISMGGTIALQFALDYPKLIDKLILVNTFAKLRPVGIMGWFYFFQRAVLILNQSVDTQAEYVARRIFPGSEQAEMRRILVEQIVGANPQVYKKAMKSLGLFNVENKLSRITASTLIVTGMEDTTVPRVNQDRMARQIAGSRQEYIPKAGHAVIVDQPDLFNRILLKFLEDPRE
jgi:3-oxoadipate enol-lactonase